MSFRSRDVRLHDGHNQLTVVIETVVPDAKVSGYYSSDHKINVKTGLKSVKIRNVWQMFTFDLILLIKQWS